MLSRVRPRAPRSGANKTSDIVNINDSIRGARGVDNDNNNNGDDNNNAINNGRGTAIPEHQ
jgi:hypothetical protein